MRCDVVCYIFSVCIMCELCVKGARIENVSWERWHDQSEANKHTHQNKQMTLSLYKCTHTYIDLDSSECERKTAGVSEWVCVFLFSFDCLWWVCGIDRKRNRERDWGWKCDWKWLGFRQSEEFFFTVLHMTAIVVAWQVVFCAFFLLLNFI